jgi:hypothetical protein
VYVPNNAHGATSTTIVSVQLDIRLMFSHIGSYTNRYMVLPKTVNPFKSAFSGSVAVVKKLKLGTAVDTDLAIAVIIVPAIVLLMIFTPHWWVVFLLLVPLAGYLRHYEHYMKHDPGMLRSERHIETLRRMEVGAMGNDKKIINGDEVAEAQIVPGTPRKIAQGGKE